MAKQRTLDMFELIIGAVIIWLVFKALDNLFSSRKNDNRIVIRDENNQYWVLEETESEGHVPPKEFMPGHSTSRGRPNLRLVK